MVTDKDKTKVTLIVRDGRVNQMIVQYAPNHGYMTPIDRSSLRDAVRAIAEGVTPQVLAFDDTFDVTIMGDEPLPKDPPNHDWLEEGV